MHLYQRNRNGFTLVELLAAIAIVAILGLVAVPNILNTLNNSKTATYNIMLKNIKGAGQELYEELEFVGSSLYDYDTNGNKKSLISINKDTNSIAVSLQGLVSNGFLKGTNNSEDNLENKNTKVILEPKNKKDIGSCNITIQKIKVNNKVCYEITDNSNNDICPKTDEYEKC